MSQQLIAVIVAVLSSGVLSAWITALFSRRHVSAEVTDLKISNLLDMEDRAYQRYAATQHALDTMRKQLSILESQVHELEDYIAVLHHVLGAANIEPPTRPKLIRLQEPKQEEPGE